MAAAFSCALRQQPPVACHTLGHATDLQASPKARLVRRDDRAAQRRFQLFDGPDDSVPLELEEFPPDDRVPDSRCRFDDLLFVELESLDYRQTAGQPQSPQK